MTRWREQQEQKVGDRAEEVSEEKQGYSLAWDMMCLQGSGKDRPLEWKAR